MFGLKPPLYYLPGKAPSDAAAGPSSPRGSPCGVPPPLLGDTPLSAPTSGSRGGFGGQVTFSQHLIGVWGSGELGGGGKQPWCSAARLFGVLGSPPLLLLPLLHPGGVSPLPEEPGWGGQFWPRRDGEKCWVCCVLGWGSPLTVPLPPERGDSVVGGHQSLLCRPSRQHRPPRQPVREADPLSGGVFRV